MKLRKTGALLLSAALLASTFAGCGQTNSASSAAPQQAASSGSTSGVPAYMNEVGKFPITKEKITVKAMVASTTEMAQDWNSLEAFKRLEKLTNIHWDFDYVDVSTNTQNLLNQLSIRLAGDDFPEVVLMGGMSSDTEETFGPTGKLLDLTDYIQKYAPHLQKLLDDNKTYKLATTASDGKHYGLPNFTASTAQVQTLSFIDQKYLDKAGITKMPETTDELYNALVTLRDKDPNGNGKKDDIPISCQGPGSLRQVIQTAFQGYTGGSNSDEWDVDDNGKVVYLPEEKGYKEFLEYCHKLYADGLLDHDFATITSDKEKAKVVAGTVGFYFGSSPTVLAGSSMENDKQVCLPPLTSPTNTKKVTIPPNTVKPTAGIVTKNCKHPEAVMSWFDLFYRPEGEEVDGFSGITSLLGYQNEQWKYTDSTKTKYEFIEPTKSYKELNKNTMITFGLPAYINLTGYQTGNTLMESKLSENKEKLKPYQKDSYPLFLVRLTKQESDQATMIQTDLDNYQGMMETKFITGQEDLNGFDKFVSNLKQYKCDDLKKIRQSSYDRYLNGGK